MGGSWEIVEKDGRELFLSSFLSLLLKLK